MMRFLWSRARERSASSKASDDIEIQLVDLPPAEQVAKEKKAETSIYQDAIALVKIVFKDPKLGRRAVGLCVAVLVFLLAEVSVFLHFSSVQKNYMTALQTKHVEEFYNGLWKVGRILVILCPIYGLHEYFAGLSKIVMRKSITSRFAGTYLSSSETGDSESLFYRLTLTGDIDNPDQRICDDINDYVESTFKLVQDAVKTVLSVIGFAGVLYRISPFICVSVIVYSLIGTLISTKCFGPRVAHYQLLRVKQEANLRYNLIRVRENAESIAFFRGGHAEWASFNEMFSSLLDTTYKSVVVLSGFGMFNRTFHWATFSVAPLLVGPAYLRGEVDFGVISQTNMAFTVILNGLTLIMDRLQSFTDLAVRIRRLRALQLALERSEASAKRAQLSGMNGVDCIASEELPASEQTSLRLANVTLLTPPRAEITQQTICNNLSMEVLANQSFLIAGESGIGKSSLLRGIAGLWLDGTGRVAMQKRDSIFFMPQKPYMFCGSLREQLLYPNVKDLNYTDAELEHVLKKVNLEMVLTRHGLSDAKDWSTLLSLGQQQRINFARLLLRKDIKIALIDEGTSACDSANEALLYTLLSQHISSFVSIGHRPSLQRFHSHVLHMQRRNKGALDSGLGHDVCGTTCTVLTMAEYKQVSNRKEADVLEGKIWPAVATMCRSK
eukprot:TRINITY_DN23357_c0_g2_i1.p1 TRINITY_DN23357_c0_g2~~TRINITY_DN23357_c0_g2_i1.p1  ORF type:complete len:668 (-),score=117.83 TRINITY_DN23357_c0_g2_i1:208-2211(-)